MTLYINGKLYVDKDTFATSMVVKDDRIIKVGTEEECRRVFKGSEIIDLKGKTVIPGFNDSHLHFLMTAEYLDMLPITDVTSMKELIQRGISYIEEKTLTEDDILYTEGWNHTQFTDEKRIPTKHDLDKISTEVPIVMVRVDRHVASLNTAALAYFNISNETELEVGGEIEKDEANQLTGVLKEGAVDLVRSQLPVKTADEKKDSLIRTMKLANSMGITSMHTNDAKDESIMETLALYEALDAENQLTIRFYQQIWFNNGKYMPDFLSSHYRFQQGSKWNKIGPVKLFIDGTLGSRTAAMRSGYSDDPENTGILTKSQETLNKEVAMAVEYDYQVIIHGIGDKGIETILNAYDAALGDRENTLRLGVNHMQITGMDLINRVADKGYLTYVQPIFIDDDLPIIVERIGEERARTSYLFKTMKDKGIHQSFSSDAPIVSFNPFENIQCAITRNRLTTPHETPYLPEEAMDVASAIDAYTYESAYASFDENEKGRLKAGYFADFIVLDEDIFTCSPQRIKDIDVLATVAGGKVVYKKEQDNV
ncbi:amidohydrolase [Alkalibacterium sp. MB6]|uniref:amidohydrolase n=1 Tax=Alkalibacterium sp. MB6 TaxID=2081965 RepID=UPI00137B6554|nr:amidohydrolase [Alkalibacterium sp. MB6]